jgi:hypothetical protein
VLSVTLSGERPPDEELASGLLVAFEERRDSLDERVREGEQHTGTTEGATNVQVDVDREFHLETGDLATDMR